MVEFLMAQGADVFDTVGVVRGIHCVHLVNDVVVSCYLHGSRQDHDTLLHVSNDAAITEFLLNKGLDVAEVNVVRDHSDMLFTSSIQLTHGLHREERLRSIMRSVTGMLLLPRC